MNNTKCLEGIHWTFVYGGTIATCYLLVAVADFLQGGEMWPCLGVVIGLQVAGLLGVLMVKSYGP